MTLFQQDAYREAREQAHLEGEMMTMREGAWYVQGHMTGEVRIPSHRWDPIKTKLAAREWAKRGYKLVGKEWRKAIAPGDARKEIESVDAILCRVWGFKILTADEYATWNIEVDQSWRVTKISDEDIAIKRTVYVNKFNKMKLINPKGEGD